MQLSFEHSFFRKSGYFVWLAMLALALVFYKERAFFMDGGFQLFNLINEGAVQAYHYRFVTVLPQLPVYLLLKTGAPLGVLAACFSISYIILYAFVYHLLAKRLQNERLGWALIFLFTLISYDTFYHIQSEFYIGLALLLLAFGVVLKNPAMTGWKTWITLSVLLVSVGFSHKLSLIFFMFLWLFFGKTNPAVRHWRYLVLLGLFLAVAVVKSVWFTNWYEAAKQVDFQNNWAQYFPNFHTLPANAILLERCLSYYYFLPLLLLVTTAHYLLRMEWLKLLAVWAFTCGYLLLYNISDPQAPYRFYSEVTYLPAILFVGIPFIFDVLPALERRFSNKILSGLFFAVILLRITTIASNHQTFRQLFSWIERQTGKAEALETNRLLLKTEAVPMDTVIMDWGVPFTAMHLSALRGSGAAKTLLILPDFERYKTELSQDTFFLSPFKAFGLSKINSQYYDLGKAKYVELPR
jgi:hypothetical protein